ncbi:response regulator transcription factor [Gordonia alkanivorans]|uniref:response regulator transcription factor n=1 Tax=Gordonia alkanivorans TaxID=84096 RepID=UPI00244976CF|nr:response regulator transcription factor [Gordonia alkanivorans]MDH3047463.1 response regulator transcription factor [Gordonia alkanivorans]MDJ0026960.1 response regulator transcription factor [Gordonia alkanivorans]
MTTPEQIPNPTDTTADAAASYNADAAASTYTVYLVDDHAVFRSGVRAELADESGLRVVGEAGAVPEAIAGIVATAPDVVLLDVHMPAGGGVAVLRGVLDRLGADAENAPVFLALSVSDAAEDVIATIRAGARGYVTKTIDGAELADAVRRVAEGDAVFSPRLAGFVLDSFTGKSSAPEPPLDPELDSLTRRELEVLRLLARGYTYREIAEELFISIKTVETHASNVLRKTQQSNRNALTRWAATRHIG